MTTTFANRTVHVVAHTHWDREWYLSFQEFRINLVRLIDRLLEMMRNDDYKHFLLDGQTVVLEDYLEIRPERRAELIDLARGGRLSIGPWYVLPDLFLVSGESIIRNLRMGRKIAREFGAPMSVGYMPDQFGFPCQMPQVLRGFRIDDAVVWRGFDDSLPMEIWWEAPDGSRVLAHLLGAEYPHAFIEYAWKQLLKNHAHDSICGCSGDEVHSEMMTRFASARQVAEMLSEHATKRIADALSSESERSQCLMITNTLPWERTELIDAEIILPKEDKWQYFHLMDGDVEIPYTIISKDDGVVEFDAAAALDSFPAFKSGCKYRIRLLVESVPGWGYRLLRIQPGVGSAITKSLVSDFVTDGGLPGVATELVRLEFNEDGTFNLEDMRSDNSFHGLHFFEDMGDCGDEYNYCPPREDREITSAGCKARLCLEASGESFRTFRVEHSLKVPARIVRDGATSRSEELCRIEIVSHITVTSGVPRIDIATEVTSTARDHRLRAMFPTDVWTDKSFAESAFDVVERDIAPPEHDGWMEDPLTTYPQLNFAGAASTERTLAIANRGLTEYELCDDERRTFALTLLRCVEWGSRGDLTNTRRGHKEDGSDGHNYLFTPEAQCFGQHKFHYSIICGAGDPCTSGLARQAYNHKVGLISHQRMLSDHVSAIGRFLGCELPDSVISSALMIHDDGGRLVVRFVNLSQRDATLGIKFQRAVESVWNTDLADRRVTRLELAASKDRLNISLPAKTVSTLEVRVPRYVL